MLPALLPEFARLASLLFLVFLDFMLAFLPQCYTAVGTLFVGAQNDGFDTKLQLPYQRLVPPASYTLALHFAIQPS